MTYQTKDSDIRYFVVAATVSSALDNAAKEAKKISLTAKNARAISMRAGEKAVGFRAITNFIDEFANKTILLAREINQLALHMSKVAIDEVRSSQTLARYNDVNRIGKDAAFLSSLRPMQEKIEEKLQEYRQKFKKLMSKLSVLLAEINEQMRAAGVIAITSKVEASQAGEYRTNLETIAKNILDSSTEIKGYLNQSNALLSIV